MINHSKLLRDILNDMEDDMCDEYDVYNEEQYQNLKRKRENYFKKKTAFKQCNNTHCLMNNLIDNNSDQISSNLFYYNLQNQYNSAALSYANLQLLSQRSSNLYSMNLKKYNWFLVFILDF